MNKIALPSEFGASWADFLREWHLGSGLGYHKNQVLRSLDALRRLWPDKVADLTEQTARA